MPQTLPIIADIQGQLGLLRLNRASQLHALDMNMIEMISEQLEEWRGHRGVGAVLIYQNDSRAFCAGGDVRGIWELKQRDADFWQHNRRFITAYFRREYQLNHTIKFYPKPIIVLMDGITMGGGVGLAVHAALRIATENTIWAMPEAAIGFIPDVGSSYILSRLPHHIGLLAALTAHRFSAAECMALNLADAMMETRRRDELIRVLSGLPLSDLSLAAIREWIKPVLAPLTVLARTDKLASIAGQLAGHTKIPAPDLIDLPDDTRAAWMRMCPLSQAVIWQQIRRARYLSFNECLQQEYLLCCAMINGENFYEGVRAMLVDKDKNPQWSPHSLSSITDAMVDACFDAAHMRGLPTLVLPDVDHG